MQASDYLHIPTMTNILHPIQDEAASSCGVIRRMLHYLGLLIHNHGWRRDLFSAIRAGGNFLLSVPPSPVVIPIVRHQTRFRDLEQKAGCGSFPHWLPHQTWQPEHTHTAPDANLYVARPSNIILLYLP